MGLFLNDEMNAGLIRGLVGSDDLQLTLRAFCRSDVADKREGKANLIRASDFGAAPMGVGCAVDRRRQHTICWARGIQHQFCFL